MSGKLFQTIVSTVGKYPQHIHNHQLMVKCRPNSIFGKRLGECIVVIHRYMNAISLILRERKPQRRFIHLYPLPKNAQFIGPLSRFKLSVADAVGKPIKKYHTVAIISGPEPQRSLFEQELISRFEDTQKPILLIQGKPQTTDIYQIQRLVGDFGKIDQVPHLASQTFAYYLLHAEKIICRSGYSTIMDLHTLNCLHKAEFIPTPGQTEQEYLAEYHNTKI